MPTQSEIAAKIAHLEELLDAGATNVSSDGESVTLDLDDIRRRLAELQAMQTGNQHQNRRVRTLDLRRAW